MKRKITSLTTAIIVLFLILFTLPETGWGQVSTATATNGNSYVVAYYANNKYYALPHGTNASEWSGTEVTLNTINKVNTSTAASLAWTLTEGSTLGQFYITYTSDNTTYYLYKNGGTSNTNYNIKGTSSTTERHYWDFSLNSGNNDYTVEALKSNIGNTKYLGQSSSNYKFGVYSSATGIILLEIGDATPCTVTLGDDNTQLTEASAGAGVTLPSRSNVSPYTFAGWSSTSCGSHETTNAPASIIPAGTYHPTANITLYPVYTRTEGSGNTNSSNVIATGTYNSNDGTITWSIANIVSILQEQNGSSNTAPNSSYANATVRWYSGNKITITPSVSINSISATATSAAYATALANSTYTNASAAVDSNNDTKVIITPSNGSNAITIVMGGQSRLSSLTVNYATGTTYYISVVSTGTPSITASNVEILYNATGGSIGYSITDEPETPGTLTAAIKAGTTSTITNLTIDNNNITNTEVPFTCGANNDLSAHTATVTLTYTYGNDETVTKDVTITQAAHPTPSITAANVEINYNSIGGNIAYTINDGIEGGSVSASVPNNSWITLPNTFASPIVFTCEATEGVVARTETVTLTYTFNSNQSVAKEVTVTQGVDATLGTADHPYTVAQARTFIDGLNGQTSADGKHVSGIISQVDSYSSQYNSITYWISDDGTTTSEQLYVYSGKGISGADFTSLEDLQKADRVVVKGNLKFYDNKYEFNYNNELVSLDRDATITVANTNIEVNAIAGQSTINVTYNNFGTETILADVTYYEADGETVVTNPGTVYPWFVAEINNANNVECTYVEHTGNTARTAYFKVWAYYDDNMNENEIVYSDLVTFTQRTPAQTQYPITKTATLAGTILVKDVNNNELTEALPNTEVYLTFEAADCQTFNTWTVSNTSTNPATSVTVTDGHFTMPAGAVTVTANATASPVLEYLYVVNGVNGEDQSTCISPLSLPTTVETPRGFRFVGWTTDENDVDNIITSYSFDADETVFFYAVFAHLEGGVYTYQRITSNNSLSDGNYLIVYENENGSTIHDGGLYDLNASSNYIDVAVGEGNVINGTSAINNATFTIASYGQTDDKYSIQSTSGKYMGKSTDSNGMDQNVTMSNNLANTIGFSGNNCDIVGAGGTHLRYNSSATTFRYYKSNTYTNQKAIQLYKQTVVEAGSTVRYTRVLNTNPTENVIITVPTIINSGTVLNMNGQTLTCNNPANLIIEDGAQLICDNSVAATFKKTMPTPAAPSTKDEPEDVYGWELISSPVHDDNGSTIEVTNVTNLTTSTYDMFAYDEENSKWLNQKANDNPATVGFNTLSNGQGYMYRNNAQELSFVGNTNVNDVEVSLTYTAGAGDLAGFHLVGNPYTENITLMNTTLYNGTTQLDNGEQLSAYYVLENNGSSWKTDLAANTPIANKQGFLIEIPSTANKIKFSRTARTAKSHGDNIKFMVANSQFEDVTYALFDKALPLNKINHRNPEVPMIYINQNDQDYAVATMTDDTKVFGLNFKAATAGKYTLSYKATGNYNYLHVIDRLTGEDVDMLLEGEYSFIGTPKDSENRFIVRLEYMPNYGEEGNDIFAYQSGSDIYVCGKGELQIFDVTGRRVMTTTINGAESISIPAQGVYIFKLNEKVQKIVVR